MIFSNKMNLQSSLGVKQQDQLGSTGKFQTCDATMDDHLATIMDDHLARIQRETKRSMQKFQNIGIEMDSRFRKHLLKVTRDRVGETFDRTFEETRWIKQAEPLAVASNNNQSTIITNTVTTTATSRIVAPNVSMVSLPKVRIETTGSTQVKPIIKIPEKRIQCIDLCGSPERPKKIKTIAPRNGSNLIGIKFACGYCRHPNAPLNSDVKEIYGHWQSDHATLPFRFQAAQTAICHERDASGTFFELLKHHQIKHPNDPFTLLSRIHRKKCGICDFNGDLLIEHFESVHKEFMGTAGTCDPIPFTELEMKDLLEIDFANNKCCHCPAIFSTSFELKDHYSKDHIGVRMNTNTVVKSNVCVCSHCNKEISRMEYLPHLTQHSYDFKCSQCPFVTKDLICLVAHDKRDHGVDSLNFCSLNFKKRLKSDFFNSSIVFGNGLILVNHNLIGTKFDESKEFEAFTTHVIDLMKEQYQLLMKNLKAVSATLETVSPIKTEKNFSGSKKNKNKNITNYQPISVVPLDVLQKGDSRVQHSQASIFVPPQWSVPVRVPIVSVISSDQVHTRMPDPVHTPVTSPVATSLSTWVNTPLLIPTPTPVATPLSSRMPDPVHTPVVTPLPIPVSTLSTPLHTPAPFLVSTPALVTNSVTLRAPLNPIPTLVKRPRVSRFDVPPINLKNTSSVSQTTNSTVLVQTSTLPVQPTTSQSTSAAEAAKDSPSTGFDLQEELLLQNEYLPRLVFRGIPKVDNEDLYSMILDAFERLELPAKAKDITTIFRVGSESRVVVEFRDYDTKMNVFKAAKCLWSNDFVPQLRNDRRIPVILTDWLTIYFRKLTQQLSSFRRNKRILSYELNEYGVNVRVAPNTRINILSIEELERFLKEFRKRKRKI